MNQVTDNHHQQTSIHQDAGTVNYYNDNNSASTAMIRGDPRNNDNGMTTMNPRVLERQMFAAFADLDPDLSLELRQALATAPALVYGESKFLDFLRTELYDVPKAAVRIANYWKFRRELFQDRWCVFVFVCSLCVFCFCLRCALSRNAFSPHVSVISMCFQLLQAPADDTGELHEHDY